MRLSGGRTCSHRRRPRLTTTCALDARNEQYVAVPRTVVFDVLLDPDSYRYWVVGSRATIDVDKNWPKPGAAFYHRSGAGPADVKDQTKILEMEPPARLVLRAYLRPVGLMQIDLRLRAAEGGTVVRMEENPAPGTRLARIAPLVSPVIRLRNVLALRRLKCLAEKDAEAELDSS